MSSFRMPPIADYAHLFLNDVPLMDVRAPVEFAQGAFPAARNIPLLDDSQRERIGIEYKQSGQDAAVALGHQLATPEIRAQRIAAWSSFAESCPEGVLYCFRGGLRSHITQQWLREAGVEIPLVTGGYKAMRRYLLDVLEEACAQLPLISVSGRTGTGKTDLLLTLPHSLDLEGLAHHRGSTFGHTVLPQPSQIGFENALAVGFLKHVRRHGQVPLFVEDESHLIGRISLPLPLQAAMKRAPLVVLEASLPEREERVIRDYILAQRSAYAQAFNDTAAERFQQFVLRNLERIRSRLGGERHRQLHEEWQEALVHFEATGNPEGFRPGIRRLLVEYYDPMYDYQLSKREGSVLWRGDAAGLREWSCRRPVAGSAN